MIRTGPLGELQGVHGDAHALGDEVRTEDTDLGEQRCELVAANPGHDIPSADEQPEGMPDHAEQRIARRVARPSR